MLYIGVDLGTSAVKLVLMDEAGQIHGIVSKAYPLSFPQPGWSEQDPEDWYAQTMAGLHELLGGTDQVTGAPVDRAQVAGLSFGGQMHGLVMLDAQDQVIRPAILWNDGRTTEEVAYLNETVGEEKIAAWTGNIAFAGFTAPKILWVRRHEPENFARIAKIMLPKDYLAYRLTGVNSTDVSDASGMLLLDVRHRRWSKEMLDLCGITEEQLPRLYESYEKIGVLKPEVADELGLAGGDGGTAQGNGVTAGEGVAHGCGATYGDDAAQGYNAAAGDDAAQGYSAAAGDGAAQGYSATVTDGAAQGYSDTVRDDEALENSASVKGSAPQGYSVRIRDDEAQEYRAKAEIQGWSCIFPREVVVAAGAGDNAAAAVGTGTVGDNRCNISLGTSGTIFISSEHFGDIANHAVHAFCHADGHYHLMGCMLSAASCNKWWMDEILRTKDYSGEQAAIDDEKLGNNHVFFLPYLMGERSPWNNPLARGTFTGMTMDTTREDMTQAVLEGVAFGVRDMYEAAKDAGVAVTRTMICGGGAKSPLWRKIIANVLNLPVDVPACEEGPGMGGAMLAMVAAGAYPTVEDAARAIVHVAGTVEPQPEIAARYEKRYQQFRTLYPALKPVFDVITK